LVRVIHFVGGACVAQFGLFVQKFGCGALALPIRGDNCVGRAADFERAGGRSACGADTLEESAVEDVAGWAAVETRGLVVVEGKCL